MAKRFTKYVELTGKIIAACYEVHNVLGPGLQERFYRDALLHELQLRGMSVAREQEFPVEYKGKLLGKHRADLIVEEKILIELKAHEGKLLNVHKAQTISERQVSRLPVALLVNFGGSSVEIRRFESSDQSTKSGKSPNP